MDKLLLNNIFICPHCKRKIRKEKNYLICQSGHKYQIKDGIYIFNKKLDDFYEGKFINQLQPIKIKNPALLIIYKIWHFFSLSDRHIRSFERFSADHPKRGLVLDFGCGGGHSAYKKIGKVIGTDISFKSLKNAKRMYPKAVLYDGIHLPFKNDTFNYILADQVFGHIPLKQKNQILKEIRRVSKPGAVVYASIETDSKNNPWINFMKKYPKIYQKKWIKMYGHYGLELPSQCIKRFKKNDFKILKTEKGLRYLWEATGYYNIFSGEFAQKNSSIKILTIIAKPFAKNVYLGAIWSFLAGLFSKLFEWNLPINYCTGIVINAEVKK